LAHAERRDLLEVIEDRHGLFSTLVAAQLPISNWHDNIKDPTRADAILDRLIHNAHKITLNWSLISKSRRAHLQKGRNQHISKSRKS